MATTISSLTRRSLLAGGAASLFSACTIRPGNAGLKTDVAIIGTGLAGLMSAHQLKSAGIDCRIVEARSEPGGRLRTLRHLPDNPEAGAIQVGAAFNRLRTLAKDFNVPLGSFPHVDIFRTMTLDINGTTLNARDWATSEANKLVGKERELPVSALSHILLSPGNPFTSPTDWQSTNLAGQDVSIGDTLRQREVSEEALRLIEHTANNNGINKTSVFNEWRSQFLWQAGRQSDIILGGSSRLPATLAEAYADSIEYDWPVEAITSSGHGLKLTSTGGRTLHCDFAIAAQPMPTWQNITTDLALPAVFQNDAATSHYTNITMLFIDAEPFWEADGLPAMMWSDGPLERLFPRVMPDGRIVGFKAWVNGAGAKKIDALSFEEASALVEKELARMRPAAAGKVRLAHRHSWQKERYTGGAYMQWPAGQTAALSRLLKQPVGRLHFAGEHTSLRSTGMEGALESGERAAQEILLKMGITQ